MSISIKRDVYYTITEACAKAGTNRNTLLRWIREGRFSDVKNRDRNGWRLFTRNDVTRLTKEVNKIRRVDHK